MLFPDENSMGTNFLCTFYSVSSSCHYQFVPKPKDLKTSDKFPDLWKQMAIQSLIPETDYKEILLEMYCPTVQKDILSKFALIMKSIS